MGKQLVVKYFKFIGIVGIFLTLFGSCDSFSRSKVRQLEIGGNNDEGSDTDPGTKQKPVTRKAAVSFKEIRPLRSDQLMNIINDTFETKIPASSFATLDISIASEFNEQSDGAGFSPNRWKTLLASVGRLATRVTAESPKVQEVLVSCEPADLRACAQMLLERFSPSLLKTTPQEKLTLDEFLDTDLPSQTTSELASHLLARMFLSPRFLNLVATGESAESTTLSSHSLLWRMALQFWRSRPDQKALEQTTGPDEWLKSAVEHEHFARSWHLFVDRWLALDLLSTKSKNTAVYKDWNNTRLAEFRAEVLTNAQKILSESRDIKELLAMSDWSIPDSLKSFYAQSETGINGDGLARTGYLSSGAFAAITSDPFNSKPTSRGHFVMQKFLCESVPAPPAGAGTVPEELRNQRISARKKAEIHSSVQPCAGCHALMDPLGFLLEPLDPTGRYRISYASLNANGFHFGEDPIDSAVKLSLSQAKDKISKIAELSQEMATQRKVTRCIVRKYLAFVTGGDSQQVSELEVEAVTRNFYKRKLTVRKLALFISKLPSFRSKESRFDSLNSTSTPEKQP